MSNYRFTPNNTFEMLEVPLESILCATFRGQEYKAKVVDGKNKIIDLRTGETTTPSGMANKYLGGSNNGWEYFRYDGKKLSEIRAEKDAGHYYHALPRQELESTNTDRDEIPYNQEGKNAELQEQICSLAVLPVIKELVEKEDGELYEVISKKVIDFSGVMPSKEMVFGSMKKIFTQHPAQVDTKLHQHKMAAVNSEIVTYSPGEKAGSNKDGIRVEIEQIVRDYQEYPSGWEPEDDYEYIQVKLSLTNNSEYSESLDEIHFCIKDEGGIIGYAMNRHATFPFNRSLSGGGAKVDGAMLFYVRREFVNNLTFLYDSALCDVIAIQL